MDSNKVKLIIVAIAAAFAAVYLGITAATAQFETIGWVLGVITFIVCISLGRKIWLLLPFMIAMNIGLQIPGQPGTGLIAQILVIGFSATLFLMRKLPFGLAWTELESWMLILTLFVGQVFVRNPVSLSLFGGEMVGGKPYVIYAITLTSGLLLSGLRVPESDLKWVPRLTILGGLTNLAVSITGLIFPAIGQFIGNVAEFGANNRGNTGEAVDTGVATRRGFLGVFGNNAALWTASYISPLRALLRPLWAILVLAAIVAAAMSGFRNFVVSTGLIFLLGVLYRSGFGGAMISMTCLAASLTFLALINSVSPLPGSVQRSLTFLPGTWDERYRIDTESSNDWRIEIWKEVLMTDRWIKNKWLGDGLGFSAAELRSQMSDREGARAGVSGFDAHRQSILASGDYHSGPVQTIRTIGYVGLFFLLIAQIRLAVHAHRQIQRCRNTKWFPLALIVGLPIISYPIFFVFVFGTFQLAAVYLFIGYGMIRILENNIPLPRWTTLRQRIRMPSNGRANDHAVPIE